MDVRGGAGLTMGPQAKRDPDWSDEVAELRERLARLEVGAGGVAATGMAGFTTYC